MGHIRLGRLPKTRSWADVTDLLELPERSTKDVATATINVAKDYLLSLSSDPGLYHSFWLLTQLTWQSRTEKFYEALSEIGIEIREEKSALGFISKVSEFSNNEIRNRPNLSIFSDVAQQSMKEALNRILSERTENLFGASIEDIRLALKEIANEKQFAKLSRFYFSSFLNRYLQFFVSKEISNHIGANSGFESIKDVAEFDEAMRVFCFQSARIIEDFAGGWYSKRNWQGDISQKDAKNFVFVALKKMRDELAMEESKQ
jgi:hypothetical protein